MSVRIGYPRKGIAVYSIVAHRTFALLAAQEPGAAHWQVAPQADPCVSACRPHGVASRLGRYPLNHAVHVSIEVADQPLRRLLGGDLPHLMPAKEDVPLVADVAVFSLERHGIQVLPIRLVEESQHLAPNRDILVRPCNPGADVRPVVPPMVLAGPVEVEYRRVGNNEPIGKRVTSISAIGNIALKTDAGG